MLSRIREEQKLCGRAAMCVEHNEGFILHVTSSRTNYLRTQVFTFEFDIYGDPRLDWVVDLFWWTRKEQLVFT